MKLMHLSAIAALALAIPMSGPALAQSVSGQVNIHAFVAPRCGVTYSGDPTFSGTINLGEMSQANGTMLSGLIASSTTSPAGVASYFLGCSGSTFTVTLSATRLVNPAAIALPPSSAIVDYTAEIKVALSVGGFGSAGYTTALPLPAPTSKLISSYVSPIPGNFEVRVFGLMPENGVTSVLIAGNYDSVITILVTPGA